MGFAVVQGLQDGKEPGPLLKSPSDGVQVPGPGVPREFAPGAEGFPGGLDCTIHVGARSLRDRSQGFPGCRVDRLDAVLPGARGPSAGDEVVEATAMLPDPLHCLVRALWG